MDGRRLKRNRLPRLCKIKSQNSLVAIHVS